MNIQSPNFIAVERWTGKALFSDWQVTAGGMVDVRDPATDDLLASVGLGLRYALGAFAASLDYGYLVQGSRVPLSVNSSSPQKGDDRFYISVSVRF